MELVEIAKTADEEKVGLLIAQLDRFDREAVGSHASDWVIRHGNVYRATAIDNRPTLEVTPISDFIAESLEFIKSLEEEDNHE